MPSFVDWSTQNVIDLTGDSQRKFDSRGCEELSTELDRNNAHEITETISDLTRFDTNIASIKPIRTEHTAITDISTRDYDNGDTNDALRAQSGRRHGNASSSFYEARLDGEENNYDRSDAYDINRHDLPIKRRRTCASKTNQAKLGSVGHFSYNQPQSSTIIDGWNKPAPFGATEALSSSDDENVHVKRKRKKRFISSGKLFTKEDDKLLRYLKEVESLSWERIASKFPGRTWQSLQSRYSKVLKLRSPESDDDNVIPRSFFSSPGRDGKSSADQVRRDPILATKARNKKIDSSDDEDSVGSEPSTKFDRIPSILQTLLAEKNMAAFAVSMNSIRTKGVISHLPRPYLDHTERVILTSGSVNGRWVKHKLKDWEDQILHVDFNRQELSEIIRRVDINPSIKDSLYNDDILAHLRSVFKSFSDDHLLKLARSSARCESLAARTITGIEAFLHDAREGNITKQPSFFSFNRVETLPQRPRRQRHSLNRILRQRELTSNVTCFTRQPFGIRSALEAHIYKTYGPSKSFTGTSGDVGTVSWAPDGNVFATGSVCLVDEDNMQYNRPYNLLLGDTNQGTLAELPDHYIERIKAKSGVNANHAMHRSQDSRLFMTVPAVAFSQDGTHLYSAGYDKTLKIWDLLRGIEGATCTDTITHDAPIDVLAIQGDSLVATGCRRQDRDAVRVIRCAESKIIDSMVTFTSNKSKERPEANIYPSCLRWGNSPAPSNYLLAGFASNGEDGAKDLLGEICLFDCIKEEQISISPCTGNIFDCAWNPNRTQAPLVAVGSVAGKNVNRGTRSVVRLYDYRSARYSLTMELECRAADINDVVYNPYDDNMICTGCTDGNIYVWDVRNPDYILNELSHGTPLMPLDSSIPRELTDTGVRFCSWGGDRNHLFTGSSDGKLKLWDLYRFPDEVFVQNTIQLDSGIMSGEFSKDYSKLLLGEVNGSVNVIEVGCNDKSLAEIDQLRLLHTSETHHGRSRITGDDANEDSGILEARKLLRENVMRIRPMGAYKVCQAVQGPNYDQGGGPIDNMPGSETLREEARHFQTLLSQQQSLQPCEIPGCEDVHGKYTLEEIGDSGRSKERIPYELIVPVTTNEEGHSCQCKICGKPARPRLGLDEIICEVCNFTCFRCGETARIGLQEEIIECDNCKCRWRPEILGYTLLSAMNAPKKQELTVASQRYADCSRITDLNLGEEMISYYQSLWSDRPHSPT